MSAGTCNRRDDAAAYVLGALPDDECEGYAHHLAGCAPCEVTVAELSYVTESLPAVATPLQAPAVLQDRIMSVVSAESELLRAAGPEADRPFPVRLSRRRRLLSLRPLPAAALASVLLALGVGAGTLLGEDDAPVTSSVAAIVDREVAPGASAALRVGADGATLQVANLPAPPEGRIYQVWLDHPDRQPPEPTAVLFSVNRDGEATVKVPGDLGDVRSVLVTDEPLGGSNVPTSAVPIITADPA